MRSHMMKRHNGFNSRIGSRSRTKSRRKSKSIAYCIQANEPSMRGRMSSEAVQILCRGLPRTSPSPSASVDLAHVRPFRGRVSYATRSTSSEPEAEGEFSPFLLAVYEALAERDVIGSTIYSGSTVGSAVAIKPVSKERHHSAARSQRWGCCQRSLRGRSPGRHVRRPSLDRWLALTEARFDYLLVRHSFEG
jgi:hypothetical protein